MYIQYVNQSNLKIILPEQRRLRRTGKCWDDGSMKFKIGNVYTLWKRTNTDLCSTFQMTQQTAVVVICTYSCATAIWKGQYGLRCINKGITYKSRKIMIPLKKIIVSESIWSFSGF